MLLSDICMGCFINNATSALLKNVFSWGCENIRSPIFTIPVRPEKVPLKKQIFSRPVAPKARSGGGLAPDTSEKTLYPSAPQGRRTLSGFNLM